MQTKSYLDVMCHLPWRAPRQTRRRILILPDGNARIAKNLEGYAAGADNVVACAEHLARRGDIDTLVMCIVSDLNAAKRDERFFQAVSAQFSRLNTNIVSKGHLIRNDIRCRALGNLAALRAAGGAKAMLVEEAEAVCDATSSVERPRLNVEFWFAYSSDIAWQSDVDLVIRTGAEDPDVVRPGLSLPPNVPCVITTTLWPEAQPAQIGSLIDFALRDQAAQFAPGYDIHFVETLLRVLPGSRLPAPLRVTIPVCAPDDDIRVMLARATAHPLQGSAVAAIYQTGPNAAPLHYGPRDDIWYTLRLVPASQCSAFASESYDAIIAPGQRAGSVRLAMPAGVAHVHACATNSAHVIEALGNAIRFPIRHVLLYGADRNKAPELAIQSPWPKDLLELMRDVTTKPNESIENIVRAHLPTKCGKLEERTMLIQGISARVLAKALASGLLLPDEPVRQSDRNYAYTGAFMMLRVPDEANPTGRTWERAAEIAIRCMLAISAGDNGIFDRVLPGETTREWHDRLERSARYLDTIANGDAYVEPITSRGGRLVEAVGKEWHELLALGANTSPRLVAACRDALRRHYRANLRERASAVVDNPLVHWLCIGGLPRREAMQEIETRYATTTPFPIGEKIRALLAADVTEEHRFQSVRREMKLVLHLADTAHSIAVEVLFLFSALTTPKECVATERLEALIAVGQLADYAFRLANDLASLDDTIGGDQDQTKESSVSILVPKMSTATERAANVQSARELGKSLLSDLEKHLQNAMVHLHAVWPSMATKVARAVCVGKGVYEQSHYTTMTSDEMMALLKKLDVDAPSVGAPCDSSSRPSVLATRQRSRKNRLPQQDGRV